jgi:hypothetical protein
MSAALMEWVRADDGSSRRSPREEGGRGPCGPTEAGRGGDEGSLDRASQQSDRRAETLAWLFRSTRPRRA